MRIKKRIKKVVNSVHYFKIMFVFSLIFILILYFPLIKADSTVTTTIYVWGYVGGTTVVEKTCSNTNTCQFTDFTQNNYCQIEGDYYVDAYSQGEVAGRTDAEPKFAFNINWDADQADCGCKGKTWTGSYCCGDDANEYYDGARSCDGTHACCSSDSDYVLDGECVSSCDTDDDGIPDNEDKKCPNTPENERNQIIKDPTSKWYGCGPSERDLDEDGILDIEDTDDDGDCYTDDDEIAAGSDPLDSNSTPADNDGDCVSDVTDEDDDNDGSLDIEDCKPFDANIYPGAAEICNGIDDNCNNFIDEDYVCCSLDSVTVKAKDCSTTGCEEEDLITVYATYSGDCPETSYVQVDLDSSRCNIDHVGGDIKGIQILCTTSPCSENWEIPEIPDDCEGEILTATAASIYNSSDENYWAAGTLNVQGSFKFKSTIAEPCTLDCSSDEFCNDACYDDTACNTDPDCITGLTDLDEDGVPDLIDQCPDTPLGEPVDEDGCTISQSTCLAQWDCSKAVWGRCENNIRTRDTNLCIFTGTDPLCRTTFTPTSEKACEEEEAFRFFTLMNIIIVILILIIFYLWQRKPTKPKKIKIRKKRKRRRKKK